MKKPAIAVFITLLCYQVFFYEIFAQARFHYPVQKIKLIPVEVPSITPMENISVIFQDQLGLMWFATQDGLVSYDGTSARLVNPKSDRIDDLSLNEILNIDDSKNFLWIATVNGLLKLDKRTLQISHYLRDSADETTYVNNRIYDVLVDSQERVWVAKNSGIYLYDAEKDAFNIYKPWFKQFSYNNLDIWAYTLKEDRQGKLWIGTSAGGLVHFDPVRNDFTHLSNHKNNPHHFPSDFINSIAVLNNDEMIVATDSGVFAINRNNYKFREIRISGLTGQVQKIAKNFDGGWWLSTESNLYLVDSNFEFAQTFAPTINKYLESNESRPLSVLVDNEANVWASFQDGGLHKIPNSIYRVRTVTIDETNTLANYQEITGLLISNNSIYIATPTQLSIIDKTKSIPVVKTLISKSDNNLGGFYDLHVGVDNQVLIGRDNGFSTLEENGTLTNQRIKSRLPTKEVLQDNNRDLWFLAGENGVKINQQDNTDHPFFSQENILLGDFRRSAIDIGISKEKDKVFILYQKKGLFVFDLSSQRLTKVLNTQSSRPFTNMQTTSDNRVLVFNGSHYLTEYNYLNNESIRVELISDNIGCLISGPSSIYFSKQKGTLLRQEDVGIQSYRLTEGIPEKGLTGKHCLSDDNGNVLLGSYEGLLLIPKLNSSPRIIAPTTIISSARLFGTDNQLIKTFETMYLDDDTPSISMDYNEGTLNIQFSVLSYSDPKASKIRYRIKELDQNWSVDNGNSGQAYYNYFPSGNYTFQIIGRNPDGQWSNTIKELAITVKPPLWATWWAYALYLLCIVILVVWVHHLRTLQIKNRSKQLEEMVNIRTDQLATEKRRVEQLLAQKNVEFANISHEFRTPITLILGPIQKLLRSNIRSSTRKSLELVKRNGFRVLRMVDQILNLEKFKLDQITNYGIVEIKPITELVSENFRALAKEKDIEFHLLKVDDIQISFTIDAFEKILLNLLSNAVKYTKANGKIELSVTSENNGDVLVRVSDTGIGIPYEMQDAIFERFNRVIDEHSENIVGAGIGLALVKQLVDAHHGEIKVFSEPGVGTSFEIRLLGSLVNDSNMSHSQANTELLKMELESIRDNEPTNVREYDDLSKQEPNSASPTVLVVEDNKDMREFIIDSLKNKFTTLSAANGKEGLAKAIQYVPDIIISDVMMPEMNGYELSEQIKEDSITSHIPVILLTARGDKESRIQGWKQRADEYLTKPFDQDELIIRLENLLSIRSILRNRFATNIDSSEEIHWGSGNGLNEKDQAFIEKIKSFFEENYSDPELEISRLSDVVAMSERQLQRKLKALVDRSPSDYLRNFRLNKSKGELRKGLRVSEVAFAVGFNSQAYFSKCFKAQFGLTAKEYQDTSSKGSN
ncbi:hybrid sensor histidine kinase/response regulator transcription factor [Pleionea litopenaei]|uniref:histidine kinase n=1 Tax=Pleionea litopenaei TaxID=3070815 RepID=A0AA51RR71_9GAMM|nr:ATP-binding protein [Pleionea sp. HL-JVS1]WMS86045.1 response regulator [Pleionea sp. HL-JVS1]